MVFSTLLFLFRFLPITLALYYLAPAKWKNTVLFLCSLVFYSWGEVRLFPVMAAAILINYTAGLGMEKFAHSKRARLFFLLYSIVGSLGMLMFFKYTNFFIANLNALLGTSISTLSLTLPLGISFYTFQTMSYSIDVYRGDVPAEHNLIDFGAYVVMFPQLIAGPIVKYRDVSDRLHVLKGRVTMDRVEEGVYLFILGLAKKVLLADGISALWYDVTGHMVNGVMEYGVGLENASTPLVWLGLAAYTLQIYFDFSGYSMMGIGMGKMPWVRFPRQLQPALYLEKHHRVLAALAHDALQLVQGICVYPPWRQPQGPCPPACKHCHRVVFDGLLACANWNFILWGLYYCVLTHSGKDLPSAPFEKGQGVAAHLYAAAGNGGLGLLCGQRCGRAASPCFCSGCSCPPAVFRRCISCAITACCWPMGITCASPLHPEGGQGAAPPQAFAGHFSRCGARRNRSLYGGRHQQPVPLFSGFTDERR